MYWYEIYCYVYLILCFGRGVYLLIYKYICIMVTLKLIYPKKDIAENHKFLNTI